MVRARLPLDSRAGGDFNATWTEKLYGAGWICASWPTEYGGKGLTVMQNVVGPTILQWGTEDQKKHFLPQILKGEISWCRVQRDLVHQCPLPEGERGRRCEQRLEGGDDDPGLRARLVVRQRLAKAYSNKMFWSEYHREVMELAMDVWGMESQILTGGPGAPSWPGQVRHGSGADYPVSPMQSAFFFSRSETIWGGTAEVQRNIVGERVLGLPKEPKPGGTGNKV